MKPVDSTILTLCSKVFLQQIKQACYVAHLYSTAYGAYPAFDLFPFDQGYKSSENEEW